MSNKSPRSSEKKTATAKKPESARTSSAKQQSTKRLSAVPSNSSDHSKTPKPTPSKTRSSAISVASHADKDKNKDKDKDKDKDNKKKNSKSVDFGADNKNESLNEIISSSKNANTIADEKSPNSEINPNDIEEEEEEKGAKEEEDEEEKKEKNDVLGDLVPPSQSDKNNLSLSQKLKISLGLGGNNNNSTNDSKENDNTLKPHSQSKSQPATPMNVISDLQSPLSNVIGDVAALAVFVNRQMIMKIYPDDVMEGAFRATYEDFKKECLNFLSNNKKQESQVKLYEILDPYTMFASEVSDKEIVFLISGNHAHALPLVDTLHSAISNILDILRPDKDGNINLEKNRNNARARSDSRHTSLFGLSSIEEVFRTMDIEGTGSIDEAEFSAGLASLGVDWDDNQISKLFNSIDESKEGHINYSTFMRFMMKPSQKKKWKEIKRAINDSIVLPNIKNLTAAAALSSSSSNSNGDKLDMLNQYQNKLSDVEKLISIMEEAIVESCDKTEEIFWRNKVNAHKEFIRRYQDIVGRAMGQENMRLKKRLSQLEEQHSKIKELEENQNTSADAIATTDDDKPASSRVSSQSVAVTDNEALIKRLRRENQELKRKVAAKDDQVKKLSVENVRSASPGASSGRGSNASPRNSVADADQLQEILSRTKNELKQMRTERDELRNENDVLKIQKKKWEDEAAKLAALQSPDEDMEQLLSRLKQEKNALRKEKSHMREENIRLKNVDEKMKKKLTNLTSKLGEIDEVLARSIGEAGDLNSMLEALVDQLTSMVSKYQDATRVIAKLKQDLNAMKDEYEKKLEDLRNQLKNANIQNEELKKRLSAQEQINDGLKTELKRTEEIYNDNKKLKRLVQDKSDEIDEHKKMVQNLTNELNNIKEKNKNLQSQMQLLSKMPGNNNLNKKIERLYKIFKKLDKNEDDYLHLEEFAAGAPQLGFGEEQFEIEKNFIEIDRDNDGFIDFEDFKDACLKRMEEDGVNKSDEEWKTTYALLQKPPRLWNSNDVSKWLEHIGLPQYIENFNNNGIENGEQLLLITNPQQLKNFGISKTAHIKKLMKELEDLRKRDDLLNKLNYENELLKNELDEFKKNGPSWETIKSLQMRIRNLEGNLRKERMARENILSSVKDELTNDKSLHFENLNTDQQDMLAEISLLKGALSDSNKKLNEAKKKQPDSGQDMEVDASPQKNLQHDLKPVGRFLQKWYVLANHNTQYWVSPTNEEIDEKKKEFDQLPQEQQTEALNWILFDTRRNRVITKLLMRGLGQKSDPKDIKLQMSVSPSGPWTDVMEANLKNNSDPQHITGFYAKSRYWRVCFLSNYGENHAQAPRYVMYEVQFWGPLDEDVQNVHFVIE